MTAVKNIQKIISWYSGLKSDYQGVNEIMHNRLKLATYCANLSAEIGESRKAWRIAEVKHEIAIEQAKLINHEKGVSRAENIAKANNAKSKMDSVEKESIFFSLKYTLDSSNKVLDAMNQHVANLRMELSQAR